MTAHVQFPRGPTGMNHFSPAAPPKAPQDAGGGNECASLGGSSDAGALGVFALLFWVISAFAATTRATKPAAKASPAATTPAKGSAAKEPGALARATHGGVSTPAGGAAAAKAKAARPAATIMMCCVLAMTVPTAAALTNGTVLGLPYAARRGGSGVGSADGAEPNVTCDLDFDVDEDMYPSRAYSDIFYDAFGEGGTHVEFGWSLYDALYNEVFNGTSGYGTLHDDFAFNGTSGYDTMPNPVDYEYFNVTPGYFQTPPEDLIHVRGIIVGDDGDAVDGFFYAGGGGGDQQFAERVAERVSEFAAVAESIERPERRAHELPEFAAVGKSFCESLERAVGRSFRVSLHEPERDAQRFSDPVAQLESHGRALVRADRSALVHASVLRP